MRVHSFVLVGATVFLSYVHSVPATDLTTTTFVYNNDVPSRFLRAHQTTKQTEERGGGAISGFITSAKQKLLNQKAEIEYLKILNLGGIEDALKNKRLTELTAKIEKLNVKRPNNKITLAGTLSEHYGDVALAEAIAKTKMFSRETSVKQLAQKLSAEQFSSWFTQGKTVDEIFNLMKWSDDGYTAFTSPEYKVVDDYLTYSNNAKSEQKTLLNLLTKKYGGESELVSILAKVKQDQLLGGRARKVESQLFDKWSLAKMQPEDVMKLLKFDDDVDKLLGNPNFRTFTKYVTKLNENDPDTTLLGVLTKKYGEVNVAKALVKGETHRLQFANTLQTEQMTSWVKKFESAGTTDDQLRGVFKFLNIKGDGSKFVISRKLDVLEDYMEFFNRGKPEKERKTFIDALSVGYGGEIELAKTIEIAKTNVGIYPQATALQEKLFSQWMKNDVTSSNIFTKLERTEEGASSIRLAIAQDFTTFYNKNGGAVNPAPPSS
ncbi:hypothetical protein PHMEG_00027408 [Phytophthora megakarya]|uniref:Avirulence (Avh) protein n=1 Tax=Phytophthora megakarya TaxID=4795 RepID=A0A225V5U5_9STRA|nr:hypothetical protein PHMEG_00027408 [Phytophthora megakarya]